ncbi:MAG: hypothetical protein Q9218_006845 [Villophora microphyllina]
MRQTPIRSLSTLQLQLQPYARTLQPTTHISNNHETILLYRALLRQSTYLPDPAARKYIWSHITFRFHAYHRIYVTPDGRVTNLKRGKKVLEALKDARKSLKYLQRANDGHPQHLHTVLAMTYGRVGKRKRQLISKLQTPNPLTDDAAVAVLSQQIVSQKLGRGNPKVPQLTEKALALLKSQTKEGSTRFYSRATLKKRTEPNVPETNSWGRKFPERRRVNFIKRWHATTLDRLMPPLEAAEWERLKGLATGEMRWEGPVPQRKLGTTRFKYPLHEPSASTLILAALRKAPHRLTSSTSRIVPRGFHEDTRTSPRELTPKFMRGIWSRVFQKCPRLNWDEQNKEYLVTWGEIGRKGMALVFDPRKRIPVEMFEGVDDNGRVLRTSYVPLYIDAWPKI